MIIYQFYWHIWSSYCHFIVIFHYHYIVILDNHIWSSSYNDDDQDDFLRLTVGVNRIALLWSWLAFAIWQTTLWPTSWQTIAINTLIKTNYMQYGLPKKILPIWHTCIESLKLLRKFDRVTLVTSIASIMFDWVQVQKVVLLGPY